MNSDYSLIYDFIEYMKSENLIQILLDHYKVSNITLNLDRYFEDYFENLDEKYSTEVKRSESNLFELNFNSLGKYYEKKLDQNERKKLGEFYTPKIIVDYILNAVGYLEGKDIQTKKLVDVSCGSGSFIIVTIRRLVQSILKKINKLDFSEVSPEEAKYIISNVNRNIFGIDINPVSCILCQANVMFELFELIKIIRDHEKLSLPPLFNIINSNSLNLSDTNVYDYVVGNPPYLFIRDIPHEQKKLILNRNFKTSKGQYDYYQIFIEIGIRLLKNEGMLGYIVPDSLLALSNRSILRKYIYNNTKIQEINVVGSQFEDPVVSNIVLILEKEHDLQERENNFIKVKISGQNYRKIRQSDLKGWDYNYLIHLNEGDSFIINHLNIQFPKLKDLMKKKGFKILISRGVELTKKGKVIFCESCQTFYPIPQREFLCPDCKKPLKKQNVEKIIFESPPKENTQKYVKFIDSINRYKIKSSKYIEVEKPGINYKDLNLYIDHIIIRQLTQNNLICATYDKEFSLTSQSFYNLRVYKSPIDEFNNLYFLGIINSKLLSFYFIKLFGSYKQLFPRILIEKIKDFPICIPQTVKEKNLAAQIILKVKTLLDLHKEEDNKFTDIQKEIDNLVFKLYKIPDIHRKFIIDYINNNN
ncbi:MAG: Eco57I restriction-modification methylase domain-containing protein [Promethearchaeota archaeon]